VLEHWAEITAINPAVGGWAKNKMVGLVPRASPTRVPRGITQPSSCTVIRLRWISSSSNYATAAALADAAAGASTRPRISPLLREDGATGAHPAGYSLAGLSFLLERRDGISEIFIRLVTWWARLNEARPVRGTRLRIR
jgi:hypothetical protein